jgi:hypothetical protein
MCAGYGEGREVEGLVGTEAGERGCAPRLFFRARARRYVGGPGG